MMSRDGGDLTPARSIFDNATEEEERYFRMIDTSAESEQEKIISNSVPAHAVYIIHKLLSIAQEKVDICTGSLRRSFKGVCAYADPELATAAIDFVNRGGRLRIVILNEPDLDEGQSLGQHPLLMALSEADFQEDGRVAVYKNSKEEVAQATPYHFIVMDDKAVRLEIDPEKAEAYVSFNHKEAGKGLSDSFDWIAKINEPPAFSVPQVI